MKFEGLTTGKGVRCSKRPAWGEEATNCEKENIIRRREWSQNLEEGARLDYPSKNRQSNLGGSLFCSYSRSMFGGNDWLSSSEMIPLNGGKGVLLTHKDEDLRYQGELKDFTWMGGVDQLNPGLVAITEARA